MVSVTADHHCYMRPIQPTEPEEEDEEEAGEEKKKPPTFIVYDFESYQDQEISPGVFEHKVCALYSDFE